MKRFYFIAISLVAIMLFLTSCSTRENVDPLSEIESNKTESSLSSSGKLESEPKQEQSESSTESSKPESNDEVISMASVPSTSTETGSSESAAVESDVAITIEKSTVQGESTSISITDSAQQEQVLAFVDSLVASDLKTPPATGGIVYEVSITRAGSQDVEQYSFTGQKTDDNFIMAKKQGNPRVWLLADEASYNYFEALFN